MILNRIFTLHLARVGDFTTIADRDAAIDDLDNTTVDGCRIRVRILVSSACTCRHAVMAMNCDEGC